MRSRRADEGLDRDVFLSALGLAAISGLRSSSGPAFLSRAVSEGRLDGLKETRFAFLGSPRVAAVLKLALAGEIVTDKLPMTPSRTGPGPLAGRAISGALVGSALFVSSGRRATTGGVLGALTATVAAPVGENLRSWVGERTGVPDPVVALLEDAIVLYTGTRLLGR